MALEYPQSFPRAFLSLVATASAEAERRFRDTVAELGHLERQSFQAAAISYVATVALVFGHQACEAARQGEVASTKSTGS